MRILLLTQWKPKRGGVVSHVENLMRHSSNEFKIVTYERFLDVPMLRAAAFVAFGLFGGLRADCDVIHAHYAVPQGFLGALLKKITGKPLVITVHGSDITVLSKNPLARPLVAFALKNADRVIAVSNFLRTQVLDFGIPEEKVRVVYNGLTIDDEGDEEFEVGGTVIAYVGGLVRQKGVDVLMRAFKKVKSNAANASLAIVGEGPEEKPLRRLAEELELKDVHFLGQRSNLKLVLTRSSVLVLPSREEGFGMILLQAMHFGVPVIASKTGGIPEVVRHWENGLLVEREDPNALAEAILTVLGDEELRRMLIEGGRKTAGAFSWRRAGEEVDGIYAEVRGQRTP